MLRHTAWLLPLAVFIGFFFSALHARLPMIGGDFPMFFRYLIAGRWHVAHYGLAPLRYAVHLCGGMPLYGHPNDLSYSLLQALALVTDPWIAMEITVLVTLLAGYAGWYRVGKDVLKLGGPWSHVLALIVTSHGFYLMHLLVGHLNFIPMPFIGWLLWLLLSAESPRMPLLLRASLCALLTAMILHAAGYFTLLFAGFVTVLLLPPLFVFRRQTLPAPASLLRRWAVLGGGAVLLCGSKLVAVGSLMQVFPRTTVFGTLSVTTSTLLLVLRSLWSFPQDASAFRGIPWDSHENSLFLSPVVLMGLIVGTGLLFGPMRDGMLRRRAFVIVYSALLLEVCLEVVQGYGVIPLILSYLPFFSSLRVMIRFLYPFSLVFAIGGIAALRHSLASVPRYEKTAAAIAMAVTVVAFPLAHGSLVGQVRLYADLHKIRKDIGRLEANHFERVPVTTVISGNTTFLGTTGLVCTEDALFTWAGQPQSRILSEGPTRSIREGFFNLMNPACYIYPDENGCRPGSRIAASDTANFEAFITGRPVTWNVSWAQWLADRMSLAALALFTGSILWHATGLWKKHPARSGTGRGTTRPARRRSRS